MTAAATTTNEWRQNTRRIKKRPPTSNTKQMEWLQTALHTNGCVVEAETQHRQQTYKVAHTTRSHTLAHTFESEEANRFEIYIWKMIYSGRTTYQCHDTVTFLLSICLYLVLVLVLGVAYI